MGWGMKRLNGWDALMLYSETPNVHTHTLKIAVIDATDFEGEFTFEVFRRTLRRRLHLLGPLRCKLVDVPLKLHHPMWRRRPTSTWTTTCGGCGCRPPVAASWIG